MNIIMAIHSKDLFRPCFRDLETWENWLVLLKSLFGLKMSKKEMAVFTSCTGRQNPPAGEFRELWAICGRRSGKSFVAAVTAVYLALFHDYAKHLSPGEVGTIQIIAADRNQAQVILRYIKGILASNPTFSRMVVSELAESVVLSNRIVIETQSCSYRSIRGRTVVCCLADEMSFWRVDGVSPDAEILAAIRPSMATIPTSKLLVMSSPYSKWGSVYEAHRKYYGTDDKNVLIWQAATTTMNRQISREFIEEETAKDPASARSEYFAEFRDDLELFLSLQAVEACATLPGPLAPRPQYPYKAFMDPSGGRNDSFTLAIGHQEPGKFVCDLLRAWEPPFDPSIVVREVAAVLRAFRLDRVTSDRYGAGWVESAFEKVRIKHIPCDKAKSDLYLNLEGFINTQQIQFPHDPILISELTALERRRGKAGKDSVDHPPRGNDDLANALAGLCYEGMKTEGLLFPILRCGVTYERNLSN